MAKQPIYDVLTGKWIDEDVPDPTDPQTGDPKMVPPPIGATHDPRFRTRRPGYGPSSQARAKAYQDYLRAKGKGPQEERYRPDMPKEGIPKPDVGYEDVHTAVKSSMKIYKKAIVNLLFDVLKQVILRVGYTKRLKDLVKRCAKGVYRAFKKHILRVG